LEMMWCCLQDAAFALPTSIWYGNGTNRFESFQDHTNHTTTLDRLKHMNT
jgi:hypothetical protein